MLDNPNCLSCGAPFPANVRVDRKYCNRRCNNKHYKAIQRGAATKPVEPNPAELLSRMTPQQLGWVAGIIEGEGAITVHRGRRYSGNIYTYPLVAVTMTDEDAIRRLREWTGIGRVSGPHTPPSRAGNKPTWHWSVNKIADVDALTEQLWPLLCERRRKAVQSMRAKMSERTLLRGK